MKLITQKTQLKKNHEFVYKYILFHYYSNNYNTCCKFKSNLNFFCNITDLNKLL